MYLFIVALHILLCLLLVLVILLQPGKGDIGAAFGGGGASSLFGPRGPTNLLQQATTIVAVMFMATSFTLAYYSNKKIQNFAGDVEGGMEQILKDRTERRSQGKPTQVAPEDAPEPEQQGAPGDESPLDLPE